MDEDSEEELEGMALMATEGQHRIDPAAANRAPLVGLGPTEELQAQRFALLRDLWATAG